MLLKSMDNLRMIYQIGNETMARILIGRNYGQKKSSLIYSNYVFNFHLVTNYRSIFCESSVQSAALFVVVQQI